MFKLSINAQELGLRIKPQNRISVVYPLNNVCRAIQVVRKSNLIKIRCFFSGVLALSGDIRSSNPEFFLWIRKLPGFSRIRHCSEFVRNIVMLCYSNPHARFGHLELRFNDTVEIEN